MSEDTDYEINLLAREIRELKEIVKSNAEILNILHQEYLNGDKEEV